MRFLGGSCTFSDKLTRNTKRSRIMIIRDQNHHFHHCQGTKAFPCYMTLGPRSSSRDADLNDIFVM